MDKYDLYFEVARERVRSQVALLQEFDRKATNLISVGGVLLGLGFVYLRLKTPADTLSFWDLELLAIVCVAVTFLITAILCLNILRVKDWHPQSKTRGDGREPI